MWYIHTQKFPLIEFDLQNIYLSFFFSFHWEIDFLHLGCLYLKQFLHHFTSFHCIAVGNNRIWNNVLEYKCCLFNLPPLLLFTTFSLTQLLFKQYLKHKQFQLQWGKNKRKGENFSSSFCSFLFPKGLVRTCDAENLRCKLIEFYSLDGILDV